MLTFTDIVTLASHGYKPSDVKELITLSQNQQDEAITAKQGQSEGDQGAEPEPTPGIIGPGTAGEELTQPVNLGTPAESHNDINKQVDDLKAQLAEANAKLAQAQKLNTRQDISQQTGVSDEQLISDAIRGLL